MKKPFPGGEIVMGIDRSSKHTPTSRRILWGVFLMAVGVTFLLAQLGVLELPSLWQLWPATFWVMGMGSLLERKPGGAATFGLMGLAFFSAQFGWFGLSYRTFWPILVVAVGVGMVIGALSGEDNCEVRAGVDHGTR
jgi:hypothetical protein